MDASHQKNKNADVKGHMHLEVHSSTIYNVKRWKQPKYPSTEDVVWYTQ